MIVAFFHPNRTIKNATILVFTYQKGSPGKTDNQVNVDVDAGRLLFFPCGGLVQHVTVCEGG